ncbi:MAG: AAA family ATPase [Actinomycetota bacterium]|nr:AAA family ATPase [Actinomycetota bacterium]
MDVSHLYQGHLSRGRQVDITAHREHQRRRRGWRLALASCVPIMWVAARVLSGHPIVPSVPTFLRERPEWLLLSVLVTVLAIALIVPAVAAGRSPHTVVRRDRASVRLSDVVGAGGTTREAIDTVNLFLNHHTFRQEMGGNARRGVLFEGVSGTGKTHLAKAMAAEAGVPFLFASGSEFQSMFYGQTNRKLRAFFRALRAAARAEGGAIGFIEEIDAIGSARTGVTVGNSRDSGASAVNELLVQMQSFDLPSWGQRQQCRIVDACNRFLPARWALPRPTVEPANVLLLAATNRLADLDPALLSPGRFDRVIHFDLPPRAARLEIADHYLARKTHDHTVSAAFVADVTAGYTPARIERLLDEALVLALRDERMRMNYRDVIGAQLVTEVGLAQTVGYHPDEKRRVAVHESGHALVAALAGRDVKMASVLRRAGSLGLVSHGDVEERFLRTVNESQDLMVIALAGRAAEIQEFGDASGGIADDLAAATEIAAHLVGSMGAGKSLLSLHAAEVPGADNIVAKVLRDPQSRATADQLLHTAADRAACATLEHRRALLALADALCEFDELTGDEVHAIVAGAIAH